MIQLVEQVLHNLSEQADSENTPLEVLNDSKEETKEISKESDQNGDYITKLDWNVTPVITRRIQESADNVDK